MGKLKSMVSNSMESAQQCHNFRKFHSSMTAALPCDKIIDRAEE